MKNKISMYELMDRIEDLENEVLRLRHIISFHELDLIDQKYKKFNPGPKEYPFFQAKGFKSEIPEFRPLNCMHNNQLWHVKPPSQQEREDAKQRMNSHFENNKARIEASERCRKTMESRRQSEAEFSASSQEQE